MKVRSKVFLFFALSVLVYAALLIIPAQSREAIERYDLSPTALRLLSLTVLVPFAAIWYMAFYAYSKLETYCRALSDTEEGSSVLYLCRGLLVLALSLPVTTIFERILRIYVQSHADFEPQATIISNYVKLFVPLLAFIYISKGARGLTNLIKKRPEQSALNGIVFGAMLMGVGFCFLAARAPGTISDTYYLSTGFFLFTLVLPYMYMWFLGLFAAKELRVYSLKSKGVVYKKGWSTLSYGLAAVILVSIALQYINSVSPQLERASIGWLLLLVYVLLAVWALAYAIVAKGTSKLIKIEEA